MSEGMGRRPSYMGRIVLEKTCTCGKCERFQGGWEGADELRRNGWRLTREYGWICPDCIPTASIPEERGTEEI
jgi:hypothetical protein